MIKGYNIGNQFCSEIAKIGDRVLATIVKQDHGL